ncbi:MAG: ABC transporter permease [Candidatus Gastranaerophilales bacterium]|nr:ABC transporter permease [bacterium]MBR2068810.1 ABC transporter permease [Candidatus Gastranaerophilales bacterium]
MGDFFYKLKKDKIPFLAFIVLLILYLLIAFADFFAIYPSTYSNRKLAYQPPSKIYILDKDNKLKKPYVYNYIKTFNQNTLSIEYKQDRENKYKIKFFSHGYEYKLFNLIKTDIHLISKPDDCNLFLLGTDIGGHDVYSRLFFGGQISLTIGFLALLISFPIGAIYGGVSGYLGGIYDKILMRISEAIMSIPGFYLLIILASILPSNMNSQQRFTLITAILALIGWAGFSRVIRGMVLSVKNQEYIKSIETIGASKKRIILKHILPQTSSYIIIAITLSVPSYILAESGLSFLGLGIQLPDASWGNMLREAQEFANILYRPWLLVPGILIFIAVLSFNVLGDKIRDILDPKTMK